MRSKNSLAYSRSLNQLNQLNKLNSLNQLNEKSYLYLVFVNTKNNPYVVLTVYKIS